MFISSASFSFEYGAWTDPSALGGKRYCAGSTPGVLKKAHGLGLWGQSTPWIYIINFVYANGGTNLGTGFRRKPAQLSLRLGHFEVLFL